MAARSERSTAKLKKKPAKKSAPAPKAARKAGAKAAKPAAKPAARPAPKPAAKPAARPAPGAPAKATSKPALKPPLVKASAKGAVRPSTKPLVGKAGPKGHLLSRPSPVAQPLPPPPKTKTVEERMVVADARLLRTSDDFRKAYFDRLDMSWIYHDAALEGVVYTEQELRTAVDPSIAVVPDSSLQPICDEIRRHREAIAYCRDTATKKRQPVTADVVKKIYLILHPEEGDLKSVKYRKEVPQHRLYFHEYAPPDRIAQKVRQVIEWLNDPETRKSRNPMRIAGRAHYDLLRTFPFPQDSGRVARLFMNLLLMRSGYPAAIIHSAERQRYYEALKGSAVAINQMVQESIENALSSVEKLLEEYETRTRSF